MRIQIEDVPEGSNDLIKQKLTDYRSSRMENYFVIFIIRDYSNNINKIKTFKDNPN